VLWLPVGLCVADRSPRAFASLPLPIALARLGCLAGGCCGAQSSAAVPLFEAAAFVALHCGLRRLPTGVVPAAFLVVFGAIRVALTTWRDPADARAFALGSALLWIGVAGGAALRTALERCRAATAWPVRDTVASSRLA
jgi:hypothetical protein